MRAVVYDDFGRAPTVREVAEPDCPPDAVVVRVEATGVCRSDWHGWRGHDPDIHPPHVPGHEFAGRVHRVGTDVRSAATGLRVTAPFVCGCGVCEYCRTGNPQVCPDQTQPGFTHDGSFADLVVVRNADLNLVPLPDAIDAVTAAALGCRYATAYRAVVQVGGVRAGEWVAVHGCGGVGLSAVQIALAEGARVLVRDVNPAAVSLAESLGAIGVNSTDELVERSGGGAQLSLDAVGATPTFAASIESLRPRGRHVQVGLLVGADAAPRVDMGRVIARELAVLGSHGMAAAAYPGLLARVTDGTLDPRRLVTREITLDEAPDALVALGRGPSTPGITVVRL